MAKLMARFDMQDRISKKIRTIRGEVEKLERARAKVNKPVTLTMRARDMATKILKKMHMFVLKDVAKTHTVTVQVKDKATKALTAVSNFMKRRMPRTHAVFVSAKDKASPILRKISQFTQRNIARTQLMTILALDKAMPVIRRIGGLARSTLSKGYNFTVRGVDMASRIIGRVSSYAATAIPKVRTFTIRAINAASSVIGTVKRALFSIPAVITVTLAAVGVNSFLKSTAGAAMTFEQYEVAMTHWLGGDEKKSAGLIKWMGDFADSTPFSSPDLFPALVEAVNFTSADLDKSKRMLKIASDMAALTPGSTVEDAMKALSGASMKEFGLLEAFGDKILQDDFKGKFGGDVEKVFDHLENRFKDGAKKLSSTTFGKLMTLMGYRGSILREAGKGILKSFQPRLDAVDEWIQNNQDTWGNWKNTVNNVGNEASEWLFSKLENGFFHIKSNYLENDDFKKLSFDGKIKFILDDVGQWWNSKGKKSLNKWWGSSGKPWAEKIGLFMGESIFNGIVKGVKEGGKALGGMWSDAFKDPSLGAFGGAGVATMLAGMLASLVLSPLVTAVTTLGKGVKKAGGLGKKAFGWFNKERTPKNPKQPKGSKPNYTMPWTNKGEKPALNTPNADKKGFKMPKGLSKGLGGLGKLTKGIPILGMGTALGALAIGTSNKEDRPGAIGGVAGGLAGASAGAAIGSIIPGVGTAIGGIIGGVVGSMGGEAIGDWLGENWSSIKKGASDASKWIGEKLKGASVTAKEKWKKTSDWFVESVWKPVSAGAGDAAKLIGGKLKAWFDRFVWNPISIGAGIAVSWIKGKWEKISGWFMNSVWNPISEGANAAVGWVKEKWNAITGWFGENIWDPLTEGFDAALNFVVGLYDIAEQVIKFAWGEFTGWFNDTVWTPLKVTAGIAWDWITTKVTAVWEGVKALWSIASTWFMDSVWTPLVVTASIAWEWITTTISNAWTGIQVLWGLAVTWFQETIWTPLTLAAGLAWFAITEFISLAWTTVTTLWGIASSWFEETVWSPISTAVELLGTWIGDKFTEGWNIVLSIWGAASAYFEENIWGPIKTGAAKVEEAITTPFKNAWEYVSGIFTKLGDTWDTIKSWGGKAAGYVVERGKNRRESTPTYARGTNFHPGGPAIVGDGGGPELIRYPSGNMSLSPGTDTMMNLPRGTEVLSHRRTIDFFNAVPAYADGVGFGDVNTEKDNLTQDLIEAATRSGSEKGKPISGRIRDIIIEITGDHYYSDNEDFETFKQKVVEAVNEALEEEDFETGGLVIDG